MYSSFVDQAGGGILKYFKVVGWCYFGKGQSGGGSKSGDEIASPTDSNF